MLLTFRTYLLAGALALCAASASAQSPLTSEQASQLKAYLKDSAALHNRVAAPLPSATSVALNDAVLAVVGQAQAAAPVLAAAATPATGDTGAALVTKLPKSKGMLAILNLGAPASSISGITYGLSAGQGVAPAVPVSETFNHDTALAVVAAMKNPGNTTAEAAAAYAATPAINAEPLLEERIALVRAVYRIDGTEELIRHFVGTQHMQLIIGEVARHIDFSKLSETDKYRLAAIAAVAQTDLEDKIIRMNALVQAQNMSKADLLQLLAAYDNDAQRKLTDLRLHDDGKVDRAAELDIRLAQYQIIKAFESGQ
ncbi:hypothetical protein MMA231_00420 [Asticcacaulis sp. MM231]|uniref:hypothetical protein n=1 Tax=Asticcacaulis sp. MM231 TaxID=3157666 RepID=UPI0032D57C88